MLLFLGRLGRIGGHRKSEEQQFFTAGGFHQAANIDGGAALQSRLEVEKTAGRLSRRKHLRRQRVAFDLPGVERILLPEDFGRSSGWTTDHVWPPGPYGVADVRGGCGLHAVAIRPHVFRLQPIELDRDVAIVLDDHEYGENAVLVGIHFAECDFDLVAHHIGVDAHGDLVVGLVTGEAGSRSGFKRRLLLVCRKRGGYTQYKSQTFENKRHLFPLSLLAGGWITCPPIVFPNSRCAEPRLLVFFAPTFRISARFIYSDRPGSHLVACSFGGRGAFVRRIPAATAGGVPSDAHFRFHLHAGRAGYRRRQAERARRWRLLRAGGLCVRGAARSAHASAFDSGIAETEIWPNLFRETKR